jgi:hypothetical protein
MGMRKMSQYATMLGLSFSAPKCYALKTAPNHATPTVPDKTRDASAKPRDTFVGATCVGVSLRTNRRRYWLVSDEDSLWRPFEAA